MILLRARFVLPICSAPIEDGAVVVAKGRVAAVGGWADLKRQFTGEWSDLGDSILLPGLINAHCHLDYTDMAGLLPPPRSFSNWIKSIVALKAEWSYTEFAQSWLHGAEMLLASGTTTVVDIEAVPELLSEVLGATPLRVIPCLELIALKPETDPAVLVKRSAKQLRALRLKQCGLSPHAPYTTSRALLRAAAQTARENHWLLTTHVAESIEEHEMFVRGQGALFDWLKSQREMSDCPGQSPVRHLARSGALFPGVLLVHANYVDEEDADLMSGAETSVVHCPRSHAYFQHARFPYALLRSRNVPVCLGTDSLATVRKPRGQRVNLDLFAEMRAFANAAPGVSPQQIVRMTTLDSARAIGQAQRLGELSPGAAADLIALPLGARVSDPWATVLEHEGPVFASMINGRWAIAPRNW